MQIIDTAALRRRAELVVCTCWLMIDVRVRRRRNPPSSARHRQHQRQRAIGELVQRLDVDSYDVDGRRSRALADHLQPTVLGAARTDAGRREEDASILRRRCLDTGD